MAVKFPDLLGVIKKRARSTTVAHIVTRMLLGIVITAVALAFHLQYLSFAPLNQLERITYDMRLKTFMPREKDKNVVIIDIDERSIAAEGRFPWPRYKLAELTKNLVDTYGVRVVGYDILLGEPDISSGIDVLERMAKNEMKDSAEFQAALEKLRPSLDYDGLLAAAFKDRPVVLGFFVTNTGRKSGVLPEPTFSVAEVAKGLPVENLLASNGFSGNLKRFTDVAPLGGHMYPEQDQDGLTRRVPMLARVDTHLYDSLSLATLRMALDNPGLALDMGNNNILSRLRVGDVKIPLDANLAAYVPYRERGVVPYVSATDVINKKADAAQLKGKVALVGTSALGLLDLRATPIAIDLPGVEIHAHLVSGALDGRIMSRPPDELDMTGAMILFVGLALAIVIPLMGPYRATLATGFVLASFIALNAYLWTRHSLIFTLALPIVMMLALYFFNMAYGFFTESRSKRLITARFGEYIPRELVDEMAADPSQASMEGESRDMTVLFSDVRSFTTISEGLSASDLSKLMNAYLTPMTEIIQHERGTVDKYIGDAIMCFWGAPLKDENHAARGVTAGLTMLQRLQALGDEFEARGWPRLEIGVGLNSGEMRVGNMGSSFRRAYTVMGDAVNLGSRLEAATKDYGVGILVSETVVQKAPGFVYRELDRIRVKGKLEPVTIYEPIGKGGEVAAEVLDSIDLFHRALDRYRSQRWDDAEMLLARVARVDKNQKLIKVYRERIADKRANPPGPNWDGVETRTSK